MCIVRILRTRVLPTAILLAALSAHSAIAADASTGPPSTQLPTAAKKSVQNPGLAAFAKSRGFGVCAAELETLDRNLFRESDYSLRAFIAENNINSRPFSALIDSRKAGTQGGYVRALTNIVVSPVDSKNSRCTVMYEQTVYHDQHCDAVRTQMAPTSRETGVPVYGAVTLELLRNMTLTIIPVGSGQCISVVKEVAY
jgi:hypothetical protein